MFKSNVSIQCSLDYDTQDLISAGSKKFTARCKIERGERSGSSVALSAIGTAETSEVCLFLPRFAHNRSRQSRRLHLLVGLWNVLHFDEAVNAGSDFSR